MEKSGPRVTHIKIIDHQELKSPLRNTMEHVITTILWALWGYWILPIITIFLWVVGLKISYLTLFAASHLSELTDVLKFGGLSILTIFIINLIWINYNYYFIFKRFPLRRRQTRLATDQEIGKFFNLNPTVLIKLREHNRYEISLYGNTAIIQSAETVVRSKQ